LAVARLDPVLAETAQRALADFEYFCRRFFFIRRKDGTVGTLELNSVQRKIVAAVNRQVAEKRPVRLVVLKARQMGVSTVIQAYILWRMLRDGNLSAMEIAHEREAARHILDINRFAVRSLPQWFRNALGVKEGYFTKYEISFANNGSSLVISSAESGHPGRSRTLHLVHLCLHKDSLVVLADGSTKPVRHVKIGDCVLTSTGKVAPVKNKFYSGKKQTVKVETWLSNEFVAMTPEHKVLTDSGWKRCAELTTDDYIQLPALEISGEVKAYEFYLPNKEKTHGTRHREYAYIPLDFDFGFLLGYYLAEGCVKRQYGYSDRYHAVSFGHHADERYCERINAYLQRQFGRTCRTRRREGKRAVTDVYDTFLAHLVAEICGVKEDKHVPWWFFKATPEFVDGVIAGYFSGDGSKTRTLVNGKYKENMVTATSVHERIARQMRRLLLARGYGVAALYYHAERYRYDKKTKPAYVLGAYGDFGGRIRELMGLESFPAGCDHVKKYKLVDGKWFVRVKSIEPYETADVYDIEVDDPAHDFETPIGIVSNSEAAFYENAEALTRALFAAVPDFNNTAVFVESTGNGPAGWFYDTFQRAKRGLSEYEALFFPWYEHEEYRRPVPPGVEVRRPPELFGVPLAREQLYWRQWKIENDFGGDEDAFKMEYPATEAEAWLQNRSCAFRVEAVAARLEEVAAQPFAEGVIVDGKFVEVPGERLHVFKHPQPGRLYVIGADVGSGVAGKDGDPSSADVVDAVTGEQVAHLHVIEEPQAFALDLYQLGKYYNEALIAVEVTGGHGLATALALRDMGYTKLYQRRVYDRLSGGFVNKIGWNTTKATRRLMIDGLRAAFSNGEVVVNERATLQEMLTFVRNPTTGEFEAAAGAHDDRVISLAIACMVRKDVYEYATAWEKQQAEAVLRENRPLEEAPAGGLRRMFRERALRGEEHPELGAYL